MKKALKVTLTVREPSVVELTTGEKVRLDRLVPTTQGHVAERCGELLQPGVTRLSLDHGLYFFKTLSDAHLNVVCGGVDTTVHTNTKTGWPDPPSGPPTATDAGDDPPGDAPRFTVE